MLTKFVLREQQEQLNRIEKTNEVHLLHIFGVYSFYLSLSISLIFYVIQEILRILRIQQISQEVDSKFGSKTDTDDFRALLVTQHEEIKKYIVETITSNSKPSEGKSNENEMNLSSLMPPLNYTRFGSQDSDIPTRFFHSWCKI